tara:strand:+ start:595 stop:864 length:270 start_codon:yes stop_codon:yes gene_type:complete
MNDTFNLIENSIVNFQVLFLKYKNGTGVVSERDIKPLALFFEQNEWKMIAFCQLRRKTRTFLLYRVESLEATEKDFAPNQFSLKEHFRN